jgi:hypothetical protein
VRSFLIVIAAVGAAGAVAGCGSSGKVSAAPSVNPGLKYAQCMRAHGVTDFPDPGAPGNGPFVSPVPDLSSPVVRTATKACGGLGPGGPATVTVSEARRQGALKFATCMRAHGQPDWPDPSDSATAAPPTNGTAVLLLHGMAFVLPPGMNIQAPATRRAAVACGLHLPRLPA